MQTIFTYIYCQFSGEWYRIGLADESQLFAMFKNQLKISKGLLEPDAEGNVNLTMWTMRCTILDRMLIHIYIITPSRLNKGKTYCDGKIHLIKIFELCANNLYILKLTDHMDAPSVFIHTRRQMFLENSLTSAKVSSHFLSQTSFLSCDVIIHTQNCVKCEI